MGEVATEIALRAAEAALRGVPLLLVALVLARSFRRLPAAVRHALWCAALIGQAMLFLSPVLTVEVPVPGLPRWASPAQQLETPAAVRAPSVGPGVSSGAAALSRSTKPAFASPSREWNAGPAVWWAGMGAALFALGLGRVRRRTWRRGAATASPAVLAWAQNAAAALGVRRQVRVLIGAACGTPVTWGVFRPVVLLPTGAEAWPRERIRTVLLHELAHVRRLDALSRGLAEAVAVLLWFDPLVWLAGREMRTSGEAACDDAVLNAGVRPSSYVGHLVAVAREAVAPPPAASHAGARRGTLEVRARAILDSGTRRAGASPAAAWVAGALAAVLALPLGALVPGRSELRPEAEPVCPYVGGRHLDVLREGVWMVEWEGDRCSVTVGAAGEVRFAGDLSGVVAVAPDGWLVIEVAQPGASRYLRVTGREWEWRVDGTAMPFDAKAEAWLAGFLIELDRHTGFAVGARLPRILDAGGPELVLAEAARTQGGHAGGAYLKRLVEVEALNPAQVVRLLAVATDIVAVDAAMSDLLAAVRAHHAVDSPPLAAAYATAASTLQSRAAREEAFAAGR